ncbi:MAG: radical SAM protein, partial [Lachnospiraceae bacterium]|nr:radical SAM protein [Lachnospiraceae bacterium]
IHLSSYGTDFDIKGKIVPADTFGPDHLLDILTQISAIEKVKRIRLGSLEPRIMTEDFVRRLSGLEKICPHFHLSLQSGSDTVLKRMNRHYDGAEYLECVDTLRKYFDNPAITTDIIAGFPGETEEEFEQSLCFAQKVGFFEMHIFPFSKRNGTPAAVMPGQLSEAEKAARVGRLEAAEKNLSEAYRLTRVGKTGEVLFEEMREFGGRKYFFGHTREYVKVLVPVDAEGVALDDLGKRQQLGQGLISTVLIRGLYDESEDENRSKGGSAGHGRMYVLADLINDQG